MFLSRPRLPYYRPRQNPDGDTNPRTMLTTSQAKNGPTSNV
jgi:hypothetical protein